MRTMKQFPMLLAALCLAPTVGAAQSSPAQADTTASLPQLRMPTTPPGTQVGGGTGVIYTTAELEVLPEVISMPQPHVPSEMRGVTGRVEVRFVVGPNGRVEPNSIRIISTTDQAYTTAVIDALQRAEFRPGQYHHQPVRAVCVQTFNFAHS